MPGSPYYKRRRRSLIRNLWIYRRLVALAVVLGLMLWFVLTNNEQVHISFPFGLGVFRSTTGLVILLSAAVGGLASSLALTVFWAIRMRGPGPADEIPESPGTTARSVGPSLDDDLPPPNYAARTGDGLDRPASWS